MPIPPIVPPPDPQAVAPAQTPDINSLINPAVAVPGFQQAAPDQTQAQPYAGSPVKRLLTAFTTGGGQALMRQAGIPLPAEVQLQQAQAAHLNAQTAMTLAQTKMMQNTIPFQLPNGAMVQLPPALAEKLLQAQLSNQGKLAVAQTNKRYITTPQGLIDTQTLDQNGFPTTIPGTSQGIQITPEIQKDYGLSDQLIGRFVKPSELAQLGRTASGQIQTVMGAEGPSVVNKVKAAAGSNGKPVELGLGNPGVAVAQAAAQAAAQFRDVTVPEYGLDGEPTGRYVTTNALSAMRTGTPTVGKPNMQSIQSKDALVKDMGGALENVRQSGSKIDWSNSNRATLIAALGDSSTGPGEFLRGSVAKALTPAERQYVVDVKIAQEALQSLRPILGAGQGSDLQRQLGLATNPGAQTPDYDYLNRQINGIQGMLQRIKPGITSVARPGLSGNGIRMQAPNGQITIVKPQDVSHYESLGAKRVK